MRKIIVVAEVSLDGVMNGPGYWEQIFKYHSDYVTDYLHKLLLAPDALLMGRITYEGPAGEPYETNFRLASTQDDFWNGRFTICPEGNEAK